MKKFVIGTLALVACSQSPAPAGEPVKACGVNPANRAYIVSRDSDDLTVIDLDCLEVTGNVRMGTRNAHMAEMTPGLDRIFVTSSGTDEVVVVDVKELKVTDRVPLAHHPTHMNATPDGKLVAVMVEGDDVVSFIDMAKRTEVKRIDGFATPHFIRFSRDGKKGYVANLHGFHVTRVNMATLEIEAHVGLDGRTAPALTRDDEGGFADAQIDERGVLYAAHAETGRVLVYDTVAEKPLEELQVGRRPWVVFADHFFKGMPARHVVPTFDDARITFIDGDKRVVAGDLNGDKEAYGVNYTSLAPDTAFVMNRVQQTISVINTKTRELVESIDVGGNTETASTTPDGKFIVATVSSANRVVVIDALTRRVIKRFDKIGNYPWSVVIPGGQNYCH